MALVPCPHCGRTISDDARRCVYCKEFVKQSPGVATAEASARRHSGRSELAPPIAATPGVRIVGVDLPFGDMVWFMVKWVFASIPAALILLLFAFVVSVVVSGVAGIFHR